MSAQQKIAALEELLDRIEANRALPRVAYAASVVAQEPAVAVVPAPAAYTPSTVEAAPEEIEAEDVELFDDEIVEVTVESDPPVAAAEASEATDFELKFSDPAEAISAPPPSELEVDLAAQASAPAEASDAPDLSAPAEAPVSSEMLSAPGSHAEETDFSDVSASLEPAASSDTHASIPSAPASDPRSEEEEEAPASSKRARVTPTSMSEALAEAASQAEREEREVPLKTPPPESGPQAATPVQIPAAGRLPSLAPEPSELPPAPSATAGSARVEAEPVNAAAAFAALEPEVATRKATEAAQVLRIVGAAAAFKPKSFLELLDATLELCRGE